MSAPCLCYVLLTWCTLWPAAGLAGEQDSQIERPAGDPLRHHQQNHQRPSFIERRLVDRSEAATDCLPPTKQRRLDDLHPQETTLVSSLPLETSIERPVAQIRHGRSRAHFSRQSKPGEESSRGGGSVGSRRMGGGNESATASAPSEDVHDPTGSYNGSLEEEGLSEESRWPLGQATIDERSTVDLDKLLTRLSEAGRKGGRRKGGESLEKLRKAMGSVGRRNRSRTAYRHGAGSVDNGGNRTWGSWNGTGVYGHVVRGGWRADEGGDDDEDDDARMAILEEYDVYDGDEDEKGGENGYRNGSGSGYEEYEKDGGGRRPAKEPVHVDIVTRFLRIIENQHLLGENCTAGTDLNLGEGIVDRYAQERFRLEANLAVNRANMLTRLWKYAPDVMLSSEYLLHASILSMVEFDEDIFAAGNCYDKLQYKDRWLYCPFAHRLQDQDGILVKDLAIEYKYLSNSSEWFYIARKNAERVIANNDQFSRGFHTYTLNETTHTEREEDEILTVRYEDGRWSKPYYDCGGGNIWMLTYTVPFFGYVNDTYFFKGTSGIDIDLRRLDIDQCPLPPGSTQLNIFAASDKCKKRTTECIAIPGLGFRRGSYRCICKRGFYYPDIKSSSRYYNGTVIEEEFEKLMMGEESQYDEDGVFECLPCAEGCEFCEDDSPCVVSLNWLMRTAILILECCVIACLPAVALFTWKYGNVKVVRAASPVLLRVIVLGAFFIYCTTIVMYPRPNVITCTVRVWLREIGFSLTYGALMLKTWRISVIFRVKSAKAVKITDGSLLKRLGVIVMIFSVFLSIRTLVAPPVVIVARTADDLKAYLCRTDWWDHSFTTLEVMFLIWGIRLCIVVRKTPSEFNESRFISMAIYNEFLLSVFLNVSMLFLQSPANPDLLYVIFFCHTQLTVTLLLCLIFGSKAYMVFRSGGKEDSKHSGATGKFLGKGSRPPGTSNQTNSISLQQGNFTDESDGATEEFRRFINQLEVLKEKNVLLGNHHLVNKLAAMQEAANRAETQVSTIQAISSSMRLNDLNGSTTIAETDVGGSLKGDRKGGEVKGEKKCEACVEKNGIRGVDQGSSKEREALVSVEMKKPMRTNDVAVSTSGRPATEDIGTETKHEEKKSEVRERDKSKSKSGHARTHAIVINLDDKSRFSEEVTV
ncbi:probable G-protein coupled receptor 158 [Apis laboriosa]|uniref:probable G-protein coupled receptor 158 n=1 Tax=Apis laboriosa TaxID=183418 RepID=UPI001CC78D07|nr:probable G-protein coupled receptor 158 [Apis laboriosa]